MSAHTGISTTQFKCYWSRLSHFNPKLAKITNKKRDDEYYQNKVFILLCQPLLLLKASGKVGENLGYLAKKLERNRIYWGLTMMASDISLTTWE